MHHAALEKGRAGAFAPIGGCDDQVMDPGDLLIALRFLVDIAYYLGCLGGDEDHIAALLVRQQRFAPARIAHAHIAGQLHHAKARHNAIALLLLHNLPDMIGFVGSVQRQAGGQIAEVGAIDMHDRPLPADKTM